MLHISHSYQHDHVLLLASERIGGGGKRPQNAVATGRVPAADAGAACAYATGMLRGGSGGAAASGAMDVNAGLRSSASSGGSGPTEIELTRSGSDSKARSPFWGGASP